MLRRSGAPPRHRITEQDAKWEQKFTDLTTSNDLRVSALERVAGSLEEWRPSIDATVDDIKLEVGKLSKHWERAVRARSPPIILTPAPTPVAVHTSTPHTTDKPHGHRVDNSPREGDFGSVTTIVHPPANGVYRLPTPPPKPSAPPPPSPVPRWRGYSPGNSGSGRLPKLNFPAFDGDNPKLWLSRCVDYFELYDVESSRWVMVTSMHFTVAASRWLPSVERKLKSCSWSTFSELVMERFGRDQYELLVRQLFHIKQTAGVAEYIEQFSGLVDQLCAYEGNNDPLHYITRFIDGLKDELRPAVLIQRPSDLDTAFVLAQLQEEVALPTRRCDYKCSDYFPPVKQESSSTLALPPPSRVDKSSAPMSEDRRGTDAARARSAEDRWASLKAMRRAQGLCQRCAEKWSKGHRCSESVQLHAVRELLEIFQMDDTSDASDSSESSQ